MGFLEPVQGFRVLLLKSGPEILKLFGSLLGGFLGELLGIPQSIKQSVVAVIHMAPLHLVMSLPTVW